MMKMKMQCKMPSLPRRFPHAACRVLRDSDALPRRSIGDNTGRMGDVTG